MPQLDFATRFANWLATIEPCGESAVDPIDFAATFEVLTGNPPCPLQRLLYEQHFAKGHIPASCKLPTGLGKTSVIAVWLIALANGHAVPHRLVYALNCRSDVDQTTNEVEKYFDNLGMLGLSENLAQHVARGQLAVNCEWSADPSRPAVICGTVEMIGLRLLFSRCGFKSRALSAGFLGQDALLVHDAGHLEPAFQKMIEAIRDEQEREGRSPNFRPLRVMELTAISHAGDAKSFTLTDDEMYKDVDECVNAKKVIHIHESKDKAKLAEDVAALALECGERFPGSAILVFVCAVDDVSNVVEKLPPGSCEQWTGTLPAYDHDDCGKKLILERFLSKSTSDGKTVYLVCASEVGVNISADHLVCDLSTFESMTQRFGHMNRFGDCKDTEIHVVCLNEADSEE